MVVLSGRDDHGRAVAVTAVRVYEGLGGGVQPGQRLDLAALGLPAARRGGLLIVFWKST